MPRNDEKRGFSYEFIHHLTAKKKKFKNFFQKYSSFFFFVDIANITFVREEEQMQVNTTNSATTTATTTTNSTGATNIKEEVLKENVQKLTGTEELDEDSIEKLKNLGGKGITQMYMVQFMQQTMQSTFGNFNAQSSVLDLMSFGGSAASNIAQAAKAFSNIDFAAIGYTGKNPMSMNQDELNALIGENGFFGIENTANRIADFVINGAGGDLEKLQKGFEGMKRGFEEAERMWGGSLPKISQDTIDKAIEKVSARIEELGGNAVSINV